MFPPCDWFLHFVLSASLLDTVTMSNIYQAVMNRSVAVTWNSNVSLDSSSVCLLCLKDDVRRVLVRVWNEVETAELQDPQFRGRVQCDITKEGHVQINMSRLTAEDSGPYWCKLFLWDGRIMAYGWFVLNVTSGLTHEVTTNSWNWVLVLVPFLVLVLVLVLMVLVFLIHKHNRSKRTYDPAPTDTPLTSPSQPRGSRVESDAAGGRGLTDSISLHTPPPSPSAS